jgi:hypothetical protein
MSSDLETKDTALVKELSVALAELLYVVEKSNKTRRGDYHHERVNAKKALKGATKEFPDLLSGSDLLRGAENE